MSKLPEIATALLQPAAYPDPTDGVELAQTQMSFVFLTQKFVYKTKKPVNFGYLDYSTLEKRQALCHKEVELNRRLCPEAYLGVVPVTREADGRIIISGRGETIEYAVWMRRLPQNRMLNVLLTQDAVMPDMLQQVARKMADFHRRAATSPEISKFGELDMVKFNCDENFSQTEKYLNKTLAPGRYERLKDYTNNFLTKNAELFRRRVTDGFIKDCHGDLHAAHICFENGISIYDCIEFNDRFRYADAASEIAFLAMDLDHYGRADLSGAFVKEYITVSGDAQMADLMTFYKVYRAYVRGKVESFQLNDPYIPDERKQAVMLSASGYFDLASSYIKPRPQLVITAGFVGTGKTALAKEVSKRLGMTVISSDVVRKQLSAIPLTEHHFDEFDTGLYSKDMSRRTYDKMFADAEAILAQGGSVILDASFIKRAERQRAVELAQRMGADYFAAECRLDDAVIKQRLEQRLKEGSPSDGRWAILEPQKQAYEPVTEVDLSRYAIINTLQPASQAARGLANHILESSYF